MNRNDESNIERSVESFVREVVGRATRDETSRLDALLPAVYDEMRVLATYILRGERSGRTMSPTALAHEAYLRLARETRFSPEGGTHLLGVAATVMRRVLIDYARARRAAKRGGAAERLTLSDSLLDDSGSPVDIIDLHRALEQLAEEHPRKAKVVEMVYFTGLTLDEAGAALATTRRTALRDWQFAKAWLWKTLSEERSN